MSGRGEVKGSNRSDFPYLTACGVPKFRTKFKEFYHSTKRLSWNRRLQPRKTRNQNQLYELKAHPYGGIHVFRSRPLSVLLP
jgi:hypothetical protein